MYELEPTLRDIYVEGSYDATIVQRVLEAVDCRSGEVYQIDTVNVPTEALFSMKLDNGNKGRVIALCSLLRAAGIVLSQVTGIVDRDCDTQLGRTYENELLLFTDYTCMEMYFFEEQSLISFCKHFLRTDESRAPLFLETLKQPLQDLFFVRATNLALELNMTWLDAEDQCRTQKGLLVFSIDEFVKRYLSKNSLSSEEKRFVEKLFELKAQAHVDPRYQCHGHDFVRLLAKCVGSVVKNKNLADPEVVERGLVASINLRDLAAQPMFMLLIQRVTR